MNAATVPESGLKPELDAYEAMRVELESTHTGEWVLVKGGKLIDFFASFEAAAQRAVRLYGRGPYLIRQIGAQPLILPASVVYNV
jgi:hypothetical protein